MHPEQVRMYKWSLKYIEKDDIVGDFACGYGLGSDILARKAKRVIALDFNPDVIRDAEKNYGFNKRITFLKKNIFDFNKKCDIIVSIETLEHVINGKSFLQHLKSLAKKYLIISSPYSVSMPNPPSGRGHIRHWLPSEIEEILNLSYYKLDFVDGACKKSNFYIVFDLKER